MTEYEHSILVVEDDNEWQEIICDILEEYGYSVRLAANVKEAKLKLQERRFSLVTVDLNYKKSKKIELQEGPALLKHITDNYPELPCIVISASEDIEDSADLMKKYHRVIRKYLFKDHKIQIKLPEVVESILAVSSTNDSFSSSPESTELQERKLHFQKLLNQRTRNLEKLEEQKAGYGSLSAPLHILNEIEAERAEIERLKQELAEFRD